MLKDKIIIIDRKKLEDERGWFLKTIDGKEENLPAYTGEVYITSAVSGNMRGAHYHNKATEWFTLITGNALLTLKDIVTNEVIEVKLSASQPQTVVVPPGVAHIFHNIGDSDFILVAYTDELYDPVDTIAHEFVN